MTLIEAINRVDALKPNVYTQTEKVEWLSTLDGIIQRTIIDTHELDLKVTTDEETGISTVEEPEEFTGYNDDTPLDTELIVKAPYEDIYVLWLESKIDYANGEYLKYNNSVTRYNDVFTSFSNDYNRRHMPIGQAIKYY